MTDIEKLEKTLRISVENCTKLEKVIEWFIADYLAASECDYEESLEEIREATDYDAAAVWWTKERLTVKLHSLFTADEIANLKRIL